MALSIVVSPVTVVRMEAATSDGALPPRNPDPSPRLSFSKPSWVVRTEVISLSILGFAQLRVKCFAFRVQINVVLLARWFGFQYEITQVTEPQFLSVMFYLHFQTQHKFKH